MSSVRSSLAISAANSYVGLVLQLASTVVISRILSPAELGVFAVAAVFAALASTFRDFGVAEYLIQKKEVTVDDLRASFTVNLAVSWLVGLLLLLLAPLAGRFFGDAGVGRVMQVQALSFALIPFGAVTMAWHRREMQFKPIMLAGVASAVTSFAVAVGLALAGQGYMSLAWAGVAGVAVNVAAAMFFRPAWFPRLPGTRGVREVFHFGKFASGVFVVGQLGKGAPEMIIGKAATMADVGLFSRASGIVEMFNRLVIQSISQVCLPYLANGVRRDGSVVPSLMQTTAMVTGVGWPFLAFLGLAAFPAIRLVYGPQWLDAVPVAQVMCMVAAVDLLFRFSNHALFSLGLARQANCLQLGVQGLRVCGLLLVIPYGLMGAACGLLAASVLGALLTQAALARLTGFGPRQTAAASGRSLLLTALSTAPFAAWVAWSPPGEANFLPMGAAGLALTLVAWLAAVNWLDHPIRPELARVLKFVRR